MNNDGTYGVFPETSDSNPASASYTIADLYNLFRDSAKKQKRKKGKGKNGKKKGKQKANETLKRLLKMKKKCKAKDRAKEFKYRLIENAVNKAVDTATNLVRFYVEDKLYQNIFQKDRTFLSESNSKDK